MPHIAAAASLCAGTARRVRPRCPSARPAPRRGRRRGALGAAARIGRRPRVRLGKEMKVEDGGKHVENRSYMNPLNESSE